MIQSPRACFKDSLRAALKSSHQGKWKTRAPASRAMSSVLSLDPVSTTMVSSTEPLIEFRQRGRLASSSRTIRHAETTRLATPACHPAQSSPAKEAGGRSIHSPAAHKTHWEEPPCSPVSVLLPLEVHDLLEHVVRGGDDAAVRLEAALGQDHVAELERQVDVGRLDVPLSHGPEPSAAGGADVHHTGVGRHLQVVRALLLEPA